MATKIRRNPPLGRVKGPGPDPHSFLIVSPDTAQQFKVGEFIAYDAVIDGQGEVVLSRVTERRALRLFPDAFSGNPDIDPKAVGAIVGYSVGQSELFEITAEIIGYYSSQVKDFVNPRVTPPVGTSIRLAEPGYLSEVLSRVQHGEVGAGTIGWLLSRPQGEVPIAIDVGAVVSTHIAIIASTGAGKSYTAAVLLEEMLKPNNRAAILVIDPHGEYDTLSELPNAKEMRDGDYAPEARIHRPGDVKLRVGGLNLGDLRYLLPEVSERMVYVLRQAFRRVQRDSRRRFDGHADRWTLADLLEAIRKIGEGRVDGRDDEADPEEIDDTFKSTADALSWRLDGTIKVGTGQIFDDARQTPLVDLLEPGRCTVMQLNQIEEREQQVIVAALLRRIFDARLQTSRQQTHPGDDLYLPYPVFVLIEEAHNFAPAGVNIVSTGILKKILGEGRKFGVGIGLISQRPGKLDPDVLSQCNTQFLLRIVNPVDQARVAESVESVGRDLLNELPALTKGQAIISGAAVNTPVLCQIRRRHTRHGGADTYAPQEWVDYFGKSAAQQRQRARALPRSGDRRDLFNED